MSSQNFVLTTDADVKRATYDTRTPEDAARELGAALLDDLRSTGKLRSLEANEKRKVPALLLLLSMCYQHGRIEEARGGYVTLVIRTPIKEIATYLGLSPRSLYEPLRLLEHAGLIDRIAARGRVPHAYCICAALPAPNPPNGASGPEVPAQHECPRSDASDLGATTQNPKSALEQELARAKSDASDLGYTSDAVDPYFPAENRCVRPGAREPASVNDGDDDEYIDTSSSSSLAETANPDAKAVFDILKKRCGIWTNVARHWSARTSLIDAVALAIMKEGQPGLEQPGAWCRARLAGGDISDDARRQAQRQLNPEPQTRNGGADVDDYRIG